MTLELDSFLYCYLKINFNIFSFFFLIHFVFKTSFFCGQRTLKKTSLTIIIILKVYFPQWGDSFFFFFFWLVVFMETGENFFLFLTILLLFYWERNSLELFKVCFFWNSVDNIFFYCLSFRFFLFFSDIRTRIISSWFNFF